MLTFGTPSLARCIYPSKQLPSNHHPCYPPVMQAAGIFSLFGVLIMIVNIFTIMVFVWSIFVELQAGLLAKV